jgi:PAS domain S-box-containing protein
MTVPLDITALRAAINYLNEAVYITDRDRRILLWNKKAEEITGHREQEIVGKACFENILCHEDKDGHQLCTTSLCPLHRSMKLNRASLEPMLVYAQRADGCRIPVSVSTAPLVNAEGEIIGGIEVFRDESVRMRDLEFAKKIQRGLLPKLPSGIPEYQLDVLYYPHDLVGGDFYDVLDAGPGKWGFLIADVRGHGVSAALYTMFLKSIEETVADAAADPGRFMAGMNEHLGRVVLDESFATALYAVLDVGRHELRYTNAGHPPPLRRAVSGEVTMLESHGLPLGITSDSPYGESVLPLAPGDFVLAYTDGVTETRMRDGRLLGESGLAALLQELFEKPDGQLLEGLYQRVKQRNAEVALADDVLLFSIARDR